MRWATGPSRLHGRVSLPKGQINLLRRDPQTQGPILFDQNCAVCHSYKGVTHPRKSSRASDLNGFGSEEWVHRLLTTPAIYDFFGRTKRGKMAEGIADYFPNISTKLEDEAKARRADKKKELQKNVRICALWLSGWRIILAPRRRTSRGSRRASSYSRTADARAATSLTERHSEWA